MHENKQSKEIALLVGLDMGEYDAEASIDELEELAKSAGAEIFGKLIKKRKKPDITSFVGSGSLKEIKEICENNDVDLLIFDNELSPSQVRNIEKLTDIPVVDRTTLILDIFALRANTSEGKLQVELAQLEYMLTRLAGKGLALSRLGGGIGTRGPGETKLETDRRHIRRRIKNLKEDLKLLEKRRNIHRKQRLKHNIPIIAIVGYTNTGKSTLLNTLTNAGILAEDKLFATLDPTARALTLPDNNKVILIDTVGFISRLPHMLIAAFKSTLEEALYADIILNICDASNDDFEEQLKITKEILNELGAEGKTIIDVFNKCDLIENVYDLPDTKNTVKISALKSIGIESLLNTISENLPQTQSLVKMLLPFDKIAEISKIRTKGVLIKEEYRDEGVFVEARLNKDMIEGFKDYII